MEEHTWKPDVPLLIHEHHQRHLEDLPFWLELAHRQGAPILELGCGGGRLLLRLAGAVFPAYGLDRDRDMLALLRRQITPQLKERVHLILGDMTSFHLHQRFALIILPCNTFSTLSSAERQATLTCIHDHLNTDGLFAFSLPNPTLLRSLPRRAEPEIEEDFPHPLDGQPVQVSSSWERTSQHFILSWHYDHLQPDGRVRRFTVQTRHWLDPAEAYLHDLEAANLRLVDLYGDFDKSPYTPTAPFLIATATPRG